MLIIQPQFGQITGLKHSYSVRPLLTPEDLIEFVTSLEGGW